MLRDGIQTVVHDGISPYLPNGLDESPRVATAREGALCRAPAPSRALSSEGLPPPSTTTLTGRTLLPKSRPNSQAHVVEAFTFELGEVYEEER